MVTLGAGVPVAMGTEITSGSLPDGNGDEQVVIPCQTAEGRIILVSVPRRAFLIGGIGATVAGIAAAPAPLNSGAEPDPDTSYGLFLNAAYIDVQRAHSLAVLGEHATAAEAFGQAIDSLPNGYHRDRGIYLVRKALAHAGADEAEQAAGTGIQALVIGAETNSARIINGLARLNRTLSRWNTVPRVVEFRRALTDVRFTERTGYPSKEENG